MTERKASKEKAVQEMFVFPKTKRVIEHRLETTNAKLKSMYDQGVPWQHDGGGFHFDLRNLEAERKSLTTLLNSVIVCEAPQISLQIVYGSMVSLIFNDEPVTYAVASQFDALYLNDSDPTLRWVSLESPFGQSLVGKTADSTFDYHQPDGVIVKVSIKKVSPIPEQIIL